MKFDGAESRLKNIFPDEEIMALGVDGGASPVPNGVRIVISHQPKIYKYSCMYTIQVNCDTLYKDADCGYGNVISTSAAAGTQLGLKHI